MTPGVNSSTRILTPSIPGAGTHKIYYSYTNLHGCFIRDSLSITVQFAPTFICGDTLTDIRDGRNYLTVLIGSQCWMAQNLNFGTQISGPVSQWDEVMAYRTSGMAPGLCPAKTWAHGMNEVKVDMEYSPSVSFYPSLKSNAFSVRCIRN